VLLALITLTGLVALAVVGHVLKHHSNAREDREFYAEMLKVRGDV